MKLASCLVALFLLPLVVSQNTNPSAAKPGLHDMLIKTVHDTASYLGFGVKCLNGGHKTEDGTCICAKYFKGKECETKICINGGKLERVTVPSVSHVCKCQHPTNIAGTHCEKIRCDNGTPLKHHANGTWSCDCTMSRFYGGTFCDKFILSSGWLMIIIGLIVFLILAFICSSNWFSRKRDHRRYNLSNRCPAQVVNHPRAAANSRDVSGRRVASHHRAARSSSADDLISSERGAHRRTAAYPEGLTQQYVVRLDTIPTFNPTMIGGVEVADRREQTPVGPPPSYDQAMSSHPVEPPEYTPTDLAKLNA